MTVPVDRRSFLRSTATPPWGRHAYQIAPLFGLDRETGEAIRQWGKTNGELVAPFPLIQISE